MSRSLILLLLLFTGSIRADMSFHGTLIEPPVCSINDGGKVDVNFGEKVGVNKVDGVNYLTPVNYQITCRAGSGSGWTLSLILSGTVSAFDSSAIQTNVEGLAIKVYQNGQVFRPGTPLAVILNNLPRLEAVPVKDPQVALQEGAFEALATLLASYQ